MGGVLRHLLTLAPNRIDLVDIDKQIIAVSKKFWPPEYRRAFADRRTNVIIDEALGFLQKSSGVYATIVYDLTMQPEIFSNQTRIAYLASLFNLVATHLSAGGQFCLQVGSEMDQKTTKLVIGQLRDRFVKINLHRAFIPSYRENWLFASAIKK